MSHRKVLHIAAWWPHPAHPFEALFIRDQIKSTHPFAEAHVIHLTFEKSPKDWKPRTEITRAESDGLTVHTVKIFSRIRRFGLHDQLIRDTYRKLLRSLHSEFRFDLVHMHVRSHITKLALPGIKALDLPMVITEHFSYYHTGIDQLPQNEIDRETIEIEKWFNDPVVKAIIPVSNDLKNTLVRRFSVDASKVEVIPNIADPVFCTEVLSKPTAGSIVACAHWNHPKDPMLLLSVIQSLPEEEQKKIKVDIIGEGTFFHEMHQFVEEHLREFNITLHGAQGKPFIAEHLKNASLLVHPTTSENLPVIIIEALCSGTPVLSMHVNGIPELINDSNGRMVDARDADRFKQKMLAMVNGEIDFDRSAIAADARAKFSSEAIGSRIRSVYDKVLKHG